MKQILIPIDFTPTSENAYQYALHFAKALQANITCFHALTENESKEQVLTNFEVLQTDIAAISNATEIEFESYQLSLADAFSQVINDKNPDLILMGTKGAKGLNKVLGTTHATDLLSHSKTPFLIIPESFSFVPFKHILWASDFKFMEDDNSMDILVDIAKTYDAEVRIAHVKTTKKHGSQAEHLERSREKFIFSNENIKYSFKKIRHTAISEGINYYLKLKGDNDLLTVVRREHGFMSTLFRSDHSLEFAAHPEIPLLILHE